LTSASEGIVNLTVSGFAEGDGPGWRDDARTRDLPRLPLPGRDHQLRCLTLPHLRPEPARGGADPSGARDRRYPRDHQAVAPSVRLDFARKLRQQRPKPGDTWHLGDVFLKIGVELHYLWRAIDQHGVVLDILVQDRRNATAAKRFFKRLLVGLNYKPKRLVTNGLRSYGVTHREVLPEVKHRTSRYLNNRAENSHRPT
jgi:hypothetical protein